MGYFTKETDELSHHGIIGQKWGVRRFENENGTLTAAGRKRYDTDENGNYKKLNNAFSAKAAGHKALSKVYGLNEKAYAKSNKTLSSMNRAAKEDQLKKAEQAQKEANERKANKTGLSDGQKKAIVVGAAVVGTALAAYGGYKLHQISGVKKAEHAKALMEAAKKQGLNFTEVKKVTPKVTEVKKVAVNTVKPKEFKPSEFKPAKFEFDKFGYEKFQTAAQANDDLVNDLLKRNGKALGF